MFPSSLLKSATSLLLLSGPLAVNASAQPKKASAPAKVTAPSAAELKALRAIQARQIQEDANKKLVTTFYQQFFGEKDITAADKYLAPSYKQHNPLAATGRDAVKRFFTPFFANPDIPKTKIDIKRVAADGDLVWLHIRSKTTGAERAVVDIFRVQNGKITEHWDVIQSVPEKSANENTMF
jgi:predicted SnoaL-like aldol condensation-catalyzing enzyme